MRFAYRICKARIHTHTHTHTKYLIFIAFHDNSGYANAPQCYVYTYISHLVEFVNTRNVKHGALDFEESKEEEKGGIIFMAHARAPAPRSHNFPRYTLDVILVISLRST
jgi:hypothetical protein